MKNYYLDLKVEKSHNPSFKKHGIDVPFRMLIVGASGTGKSLTVLNLIKIIDKTFKQIIICCKSKAEPLYEYLETKLPDESIVFYEGEIPPIESFDDNIQRLIVFDDLVLSKDLQPGIGEYFIRGRKKGFSCIYISQNYFSIPKPIRSNANIIILKKINSKKDLRLIVTEFNMPDFDNLDAFAKYYRQSIKEVTDLIMINIDNNTVRRSLLLPDKK